MNTLGIFSSEGGVPACSDWAKRAGFEATSARKISESVTILFFPHLLKGEFFIFNMIFLSIPLIDDDGHPARSARTEPGIDDIGEDGTEGEAETDGKEVIIIRFQLLEVQQDFFPCGSAFGKRKLIVDPRSPSQGKYVEAFEEPDVDDGEQVDAVLAEVVKIVGTGERGADGPPFFPKVESDGQGLVPQILR
jgi:hypothetical protein